MAKKISQLTQATEVKSDDVTVIVQDGETKKLPLNMMVTKQDIENKKIAGLAKLDEIEATYENDTYTPTITVKNKSSVKVGEGDEVDYSANVMDGHAKSAILSGMTLVNLHPAVYGIKGSGEGIFYVNVNLTKDLFETNTKYLVRLYNTDSAIKRVYMKHCVTNTLNLLENNCAIFTTKSKFDDNEFTNNKIHFYSDESLSIERVANTKVLICEYQDGMENWDIPYFEGMQSVKLPVLTTTGKNLFDINSATLTGHSNSTIVDGGINATYSAPFETYINKGTPLKLKSGTYTLSFENQTIIGDGVMLKIFANNKLIRQASSLSVFELFENSSVYFSVIRNGNSGTSRIEKIQLEQGTQATPYEPYKSNILTVNEEVELRGIGDVKDTLDLTTGELTEHIGEVVLNGSENWLWAYDASDTRYSIYRTTLSDVDTTINNSVLNCLSDKVKTDKWSNIYANFTDKTFGLLSNQQLRVQFNGTLEELKMWLSETQPTIQYLKQKSIKTVDLMPSGTHPSTTPYCWKNGHIQLSSSGLLPNLEYSVVTSRAGQINQNATMIVKNDKRIFDLEILLAGGLVNTTYQALTLQNQVETGLSKVSLSSETEPDYLLYHMIMKLIEEKAYKLDDLTEKVSVFYLYEKLSDEQFETIYSALYPFVEDEIVEEPVVEELPEVVEDEVIM